MKKCWKIQDFQVMFAKNQSRIFVTASEIKYQIGLSVTVLVENENELRNWVSK